MLTPDNDHRRTEVIPDEFVVVVEVPSQRVDLLLTYELPTEPPYRGGILVALLKPSTADSLLRPC
jgi:hypothetical protein